MQGLSCCRVPRMPLPARYPLPALSLSKELGCLTIHASNFGMHQAAWAHPACKEALRWDGQSIVPSKGQSQLAFARLHSCLGTWDQDASGARWLSFLPCPKVQKDESRADLGMEARQSRDVGELEVLSCPQGRWSSGRMLCWGADSSS